MINVVDSIMGAGKTQWIIQHMSKSEGNFIYITPYLDESTRIRGNCKNKNFISPDESKMGTKTRHFKYLVSNNKNITSTHSLFKGADEELLELLRSQEYSLVLDEVLEVVEPLKASKKDLKEILDRYAHVDKDSNELIWDDMDYNGNHKHIMDMAINGSLTVIKNTILLWNFPVEVFKAFKDVYILTYMFDCQIQKYYYDYYDVEYNKYSIDRDVNGKSVLVNYGESEFENRRKNDIKRLLNVYDGKLNTIGEDKNALSKSWFDKHKNSILTERLQKNIYSYFYNNVKTKSKLNAWTTFKDYKKELSGKGYTRGFISLNMRASNDYKHKEAMAYVSNRFIFPFLLDMFKLKNICIDQENWALSEMLQWIWRGCIREDKEMSVYIPSKRMRDNLLNWIGK